MGSQQLFSGPGQYMLVTSSCPVLAPYMTVVAKQVEPIQIIVNTASQLRLSHVGTNLTPAVFVCVPLYVCVC